MAGRYHKTPFQNSTPVLLLPRFCRQQPVTAKSMSRASTQSKYRLALTCTPQGTPSVSARIPLIIQYLCRLVVCSRGAGGSRNDRKVFSRLACGKKTRFSPLTCPFGVSCCPVVSEGVLPFQCRGSLVGWVPRRLCWLRALVASRFAGGLRGPSRRLGPNGGAAP